jgi:hypothetical protein
MHTAKQVASLDVGEAESIQIAINISQESRIGELRPSGSLVDCFERLPIKPHLRVFQK